MRGQTEMLSVFSELLTRAVGTDVQTAGGLIPQSDFLDCRPAKLTRRLEEENVLIGPSTMQQGKRQVLQPATAGRVQQGGQRGKCAISGFISGYLSGPSIHPSIQLLLSAGSSLQLPFVNNMQLHLQLMSHSLSLDTPINCISNGHRCAKKKE